MIVNRLGYRVGILVASVAALSFLAMVAFYVRQTEPRKRQVAAATVAKIGSAKSEGLLSLFRIFRNRSILMNLLFSSIPFSLAYVGVFQYILPMYMGGIKKYTIMSK